jgi:carbon storage regulator
MNIINIAFEEKLYIYVGNDKIELVAFKTLEHGNVKFGVNAPRSVQVHREEIYHAIKEKNALNIE